MRLTSPKLVAVLPLILLAQRVSPSPGDTPAVRELRATLTGEQLAQVCAEGGPAADAPGVQRPACSPPRSSTTSAIAMCGVTRA